MESHHWVMLGIILIIGYLLGASFPNLAKTIGVGAG